MDFAADWGKRHLGLPSISSTGTAWDFGVYATVPLFDGWRTKGQVAQARSNLASANIDELKLREGITLEVRTAVDSAREAVALLDALSGPVKQAEQLLFLAEKGFELGVKTRLEVQDAEQNVNTARANLAVAQRDYRLARVNLDWVAGVLDGRRGAARRARPSNGYQGTRPAACRPRNTWRRARKYAAAPPTVTARAIASTRVECARSHATVAAPSTGTSGPPGARNAPAGAGPDLRIWRAARHTAR